MRLAGRSHLLELAADPGVVGKLERQLKAAKTRISNLTMEIAMAWEVRNERRSAPKRKLRTAFHPDRASDLEKPGMTKAAQIANELADNLSEMLR